MKNITLTDEQVKFLLISLKTEAESAEEEIEEGVNVENNTKLIELYQPIINQLKDI